jgi:hypothetical protein
MLEALALTSAKKFLKASSASEVLKGGNSTRMTCVAISARNHTALSEPNKAFSHVYPDQLVNAELRTTSTSLLGWPFHPDRYQDPLSQIRFHCLINPNSETSHIAAQGCQRLCKTACGWARQ